MCLGQFHRNTHLNAKYPAKSTHTKIQSTKSCPVTANPSQAEPVPEGRLEEVIELALDFISNPWNIWKTGRLSLQRTVLRLAFSERLAYCREEGYRTPKTTLPFNMLGGSNMQNCGMVPLAGLEPARPCGQQILSLSCLPIPPQRHERRSTLSAGCGQAVRNGRGGRFRRRSVVPERGLHLVDESRMGGAFRLARREASHGSLLTPRNRCADHFDG